MQSSYLKIGVWCLWPAEGCPDLPLIWFPIQFPQAPESFLATLSALVLSCDSSQRSFLYAAGHLSASKMITHINRERERVRYVQSSATNRFQQEDDELNVDRSGIRRLGGNCGWKGCCSKFGCKRLLDTEHRGEFTLHYNKIATLITSVKKRFIVVRCV